MSIERRADGTEVDPCKVQCKGHGRIWVSHCRECAGLPPEPMPTVEEMFAAIESIAPGCIVPGCKRTDHQWRCCRWCCTIKHNHIECTDSSRCHCPCHEH